KRIKAAAPVEKHFGELKLPVEGAQAAQVRMLRYFVGDVLAALERVQQRVAQGLLVAGVQVVEIAGDQQVGGAPQVVRHRLGPNQQVALCLQVRDGIHRQTRDLPPQLDYPLHVVANALGEQVRRAAGVQVPML